MEPARETSFVKTVADAYLKDAREAVPQGLLTGALIVGGLGCVVLLQTGLGAIYEGEDPDSPLVQYLGHDDTSFPRTATISFFVTTVMFPVIH